MGGVALGDVAGGAHRVVGDLGDGTLRDGEKEDGLESGKTAQFREVPVK